MCLPSFEQEVTSGQSKIFSPSPPRVLQHSPSCSPSLPPTVAPVLRSVTGDHTREKKRTTLKALYSEDATSFAIHHPSPLPRERLEGMASRSVASLASAVLFASFSYLFTFLVFCLFIIFKFGFGVLWFAKMVLGFRLGFSWFLISSLVLGLCLVVI